MKNCSAIIGLIKWSIRSIALILVQVCWLILHLNARYVNVLPVARQTLRNVYIDCRYGLKFMLKLMAPPHYVQLCRENTAYLLCLYFIVQMCTMHVHVHVHDIVNNYYVGKAVSVTVVPSELQARLPTENDVFLTNWVTVNGTLYKKHCGLLLQAKHDIPVFGKLLDIYVVNTVLYFYVNVLETVEYSTHFHCFIVKKSPRDGIVLSSDLSLHVPHHIRALPGQPGKQCIVPCYHFPLL